VPGDVVLIDLGDGASAFARVLEEPLMAFYGARYEGAPRLNETVVAPVIFKVCVMNHAVTSGRWRVVGHVPLTEDLLDPPVFFKQDPVTGLLSTTTDGSDESPASLEEVVNLERAAVWDPEHVEDRLRDHFAGRTNKWVESLRPRVKS
jgi:hypothetical protein